MSSSLKTRVVETKDGRFMPQFWRGWFMGWRLLAADADTSGTMLESLLEQPDPARAAQFESEREAKEFLDRFNARIDAYWQRTFEAEARAREGVAIKRVVS